MTGENDLHPHDDLAIYALDALDPDERAALEAHLAGCPACRAELDEHRATLARLVVPAEEPPPSVWAGIASRLPPHGERPAPPAPPAPLAPPTPLPDAGATGRERGDARTGYDTEAVDDAAPAVPLHAPLHVRRRGLAERAGWLAAAAVLVVALALGGLLAIREDEPRTVADLAAAAADAPGAIVIPLESDAGDEVARVVLAAGAGATDYVIFDDLAQLPAGRSYQLWKTEGLAPPVSLGVLGDGSGEAAAISAPAGVTSVVLSEEPDTGVAAPTGPIVAIGEATPDA